MLFAIISPYVYGQAVALNVAGTTNVPHVNIGDAIRFTIPLPPLNEQRRIISLIETLLDKVNEYGNISNVLSNLDTALPLLIKKSILQYAVEGKLVPQDPNDEPASALVERIAEERKALVKSGKLKRDKNESVIFRGADRPAYRHHGRRRIRSRRILLRSPNPFRPLHTINRCCKPVGDAFMVDRPPVIKSRKKRSRLACANPRAGRD